MNQSSRYSKIWIGIDDDGGGTRYRLWQEIGGENVEEGADVTQCTQYLHGDNEKSVVMVRAKYMKTELSNSRYNRQVIASGNCLLNFNPILILRFSGWNVLPSDAPLSSVRSKSNMK